MLSTTLKLDHKETPMTNTDLLLPRVVLLSIIGLAALAGDRQLAADTGPFPTVPATPAELSEQTFETQHGFRMELLAHEPMVSDPVDMAYDENGRAYVVEMRGYPFPEEKDATPNQFIGQVRLLEDEDGDGRFDRSDVFADGLSWPTTVACWKGGVFVAAAPDIWYFRDTTGDRKADESRRVFTGFGRGNIQAIMNSMRWGLDNRIYGAASGNGGLVRPVDDVTAEPVSLSRRDFCFAPETCKLEAISGGARFGSGFDDWGNRFLCNIRNPAQHVVFPSRYDKRNPYQGAATTLEDVAASGDQIPVFRISPPEVWRSLRAARWSAEGINVPRSELIGAGFWTSSSGVTIYRGGAYPKSLAGNIFVGEVAGNLIHRQVVRPDGVTFKSERADLETEFVRSTDIWFRPVNFVNAPDGTLHVLDMYRETIEHPWSIPDDIKARLDLTSGNRRGRIYRLRPPDFQLPKRPDLGVATSAELVHHLASPHSWWRETAQRLLFERQDASVVNRLRQLLHRGDRELERLHALATLRGLGGLTAPDLLIALADDSKWIRRHAVMLSEARLSASPAIEAAVVDMASDPAVEVRFQVALSLGEHPKLPALASVLAQIAGRDAGDSWMRRAVVSSSTAVMDQLLVALLQTNGHHSRTGSAELLQELATLVVRSENPTALENVVDALEAYSKANRPADFEYSIFVGLGRGLASRNEHLSSLAAGHGGVLARRLAALRQEASATALDSQKSDTMRTRALQVLGSFQLGEVEATLIEAFESQNSRAVQFAALRTLGQYSDQHIAEWLLARMPECTPPLRQEIVEILLSRSAWAKVLVEAIDHGELLANQVAFIQRGRLLRYPDAEIAAQAKLLFGSDRRSPRRQVVSEYSAALQLPADRQRGVKVFRQHCMTCHRLGNEGHDLAPNLATVKHRSREELLLHVLDPNREVPPQYMNYTIVLKRGRVLNGIVVAETDTSVTLRRGENSRDVISRKDVESIRSTGMSIMPEGFERQINHQEMADLIALLQSIE